MELLRGAGPLYARIYRNYREAILCGEITSGSKLPSSRDLAAELGVSRNVVLLAYEQLLSEGYLETFHGRGTFVLEGLEPAFGDRPAGRQGSLESQFRPQLSALGRRLEKADRDSSLTPPTPPKINFEYHHIRPNRQTMSLFGRALKRAAEKKDHTYPDPRGLPDLRHELARYLLRHKGFRADVDNIIVVNGSQQGLDLVSRVLLAPGDRLIMEDPQYQGARSAFEAAGAEIRFIPVDGGGLPTTALGAFKESYKLVHVTPAHQFPSGAVMPLARRLELIKWCRRRNVVILEDDYDSDFRYGSNPIPPLRSLDESGVVLYLGSFAKSFSPALRFGYVVVPDTLRNAMLGAKHLADLGSPLVIQRAVCDLLRQGAYERHVRRASRLYRKRHAALVEALQETFGDDIEISGSAAGLHLLAWFPRLKANAAAEIIERADRKGVRVYSPEHNYVTPPKKAGLLLGFANLDEADIRKGIEILGQVVRSQA